MRLEHDSFCASLAAATVGLLGCSQGGQVNVSAGAINSAPGESNAAPVPMAETASLLVTINEVEVHLAGSEMQEHQEGQEMDDGGWLTVFDGARAIDVLDADADKVFLASITVPAGRITQVRLLLDPAMELVLDGKSFPVSCSACTHSGLKVVIPGAVTVAPGGTLDLTLDLDARASLLIDAHGYHLTPVIRIVNKPMH